MNQPVIAPPPNDESSSLVVNADFVFFVQVIALLTAVNSLLWLAAPLPGTRQIASLFWAAGTLFLMLEISYRLAKSRQRRVMIITYHGWLDLVGSLPIPLITLLRPWHVWRVTRRLKRADIRDMERVVVIRRARATILSVLIASVLIFEFGSIFILRVEAGASAANIETPSDALWWSMATISTVGYGDRFPVTNHGRIIGAVMIVAGVAIFTSLTSFLAHWFIVRRGEPLVMGGAGSETVEYPRLTAAKDMLDDLAARPDRQRVEALLAVVTMILEADRQRGETDES